MVYLTVPDWPNFRLIDLVSFVQFGLVQSRPHWSPCWSTPLLFVAAFVHVIRLFRLSIVGTICYRLHPGWSSFRLLGSALIVRCGRICIISCCRPSPFGSNIGHPMLLLTSKLVTHSLFVVATFAKSVHRTMYRSLTKSSVLRRHSPFSSHSLLSIWSILKLVQFGPT